MTDEHSRTEMLLGADALRRIFGAHVAIFGLGGVGGTAAEALARAGVGRLTLVDGDCVSLSNLNRQAVALRSTVGMPKTEAAARRCLDINPSIDLRLLHAVYSPETREEFFAPYDYIIDAIDSVTAKLDLIVQAQRRRIPIISALGAGNRLDPSRLRYADVYSTETCPLARVMRHELRRRGVDSLAVVYSDEPPAAPRFPAPDGRPSTPGSVPWVPPAMGLMLAGYVMRAIAGLPDIPLK